MNFSELQLDTTLVRGLQKMGITHPTDIQREAIPHILSTDNRHVLGQAKTGTGKTLTYVLPLLQLIKPKDRTVQALIIVPTRELCKQIHDVFHKLAHLKKIKLVEVYGGVSISRQIDKIRGGAQIVVATPGRLIDISRRKKINLKTVQYVVLDEADRMLDMGFLPDMEYILLRAMRGAKPQLLLFSATLANKIRKMVNKFTHGNNIIEVNVSEDERTVENCEQSYYLVKDPAKKYAYLIELINSERPDNMIVFTNTKRKADRLYKSIMNETKIDTDVYFQSAVLHGDITQHKREQITNRFRNKDVNCLLATNVAARGLDFPQVTHIINYDFPYGKDAPDKYIHRIGRTARMDRTKDGCTQDGNAISFVLREDKENLSKVERIIQREIKRKELPQIHPIAEYNYVKKGRRSKNRRRRSRNSRRTNRRSYKKRNKRHHKSRRSNSKSN